MKRLSTVVMLCAVAMSATAQMSYSDIRAIRGAGAVPTSVDVLPDGEHYVIRIKNKLYKKGFENGKHPELLCEVESGSSFTNYSLSADGRMVLFADSKSVKPIYRHSFTADYYLSINEQKRCILRGVRDASFSPDSRTIAYSKDNDLWLYDIAAQKSKRVTHDGQWNVIINGTSDWVYEEEYGFTQAYSFSPDGKQIAFLRFNESQVPMFEMMRYDDTLYNRAYSFKYPKAGDANSTVTLWLYDITTGGTRQIPTGEETDNYIFNPRWTPAGELYFYRVNRLQNHFEVILCRDNGKQRVIYEESSPKYVERPNAATIRFVDKSRFIVKEETSTGWMHLYMHDVSRGRLYALTSGRWEVTEVVGADENYVYFLSTMSSPLSRDLCRVTLKGKHCEQLTKTQAYRIIKSDPTMTHYFMTESTASTPPVMAAYKKSGETLFVMRDSRKYVDELNESLPEKQFAEFVTPRGDTLSYYIQLPEDFNPTKRYPVLLTQYSGPGSQSVRNRWSADWEDALPSHGYIVACCDGRGTGFRGEAFKKCTYANLGHDEVEDQISFARMLGELPYVDKERIGIYGWSYGGFMSLNCALRSEGLFRMAIAVAPVTSWRYYDSIYTEIYNGLPQNNPEGYDANSPLSVADGLAKRTRLLMIHGTADDNVHFQNTMEMCRRLNKAGKQYDMMVYPDQNHSMFPSCSTAVREKMLEYTLNNL